MKQVIAEVVGNLWHFVGILGDWLKPKVNQNQGIFWSVASVVLIATAFKGYVVVLEKPVSPANDGDRPSLEQVDNAVGSKLEYVIEGIKEGQIVFHTPKEMTVGDTTEIEVRIARSYVGDLAEGMKRQDELERAMLKITREVGVELSGTEGFFNVVLKTKEEKVIPEGQFAQWILFEAQTFRPQSSRRQWRSLGGALGQRLGQGLQIAIR